MQLPWIKQMLTNYGIEQRTLSIHCDNSNAINISKYLVLHSRTKHIEISHHFIRDLIEKMVVFLEFIPIEHQFANIFTKPLNSLRFEYLRKSLCICLIDLSSYKQPSKVLRLVFISFCVSFGLILFWAHDFCLFT